MCNKAGGRFRFGFLLERIRWPSWAGEILDIICESYNMLSVGCEGDLSNTWESETPFECSHVKVTCSI